MMLITLPVFMPIVQRLEIDLIWFGVLYLICMQLGAAAASRAPVDDDEGGRTATSDDGTHFSGGCALHRNEHRASAHHHCYPQLRPGYQIFWGNSLILSPAYKAKLAGRPPERHLLKAKADNEKRKANCP